MTFGPPVGQYRKPASPLGRIGPQAAGANEEVINKIIIKMEKQKAGNKEKTVMKVYFNDDRVDALYVFFRQAKFFRLIRRCDQVIIGSMSDDINDFDFFRNTVPEGLKVVGKKKKQTITFCETHYMFPFEFVIFLACCHALTSDVSRRLETLTNKFMKQITQIFRRQVEEVDVDIGNLKALEGNRTAKRACLKAFGNYPYLFSEYVNLMRQN